MSMNFSQIFSNNLKTILAEKGISQLKLSKLVHKEAPYINVLTKGTITPTKETIAQIAEALGVEPGELTKAPENQGDLLDLAGMVSAGRGIDAPAEPGTRIRLSDTLPGAEISYRVVGNSMVQSGIYDGDYIGVRRNPKPDDGEVVVARVDDVILVKRIQYKNGVTWLLPMDALDRGEPVAVGEDDEVIGVVTSRAGALNLARRERARKKR